MKPYKRTVQYYETDKMAIVHHSNYIRWFEEARIYMMEQLGYSYNAMENMGIMMPVLGVSAEYKTGAAYGESVDIAVSIIEFNGIKMSFGYRVTDSASGVLRMSGTSSHCFVNSDFKPCSVKKLFPEFYEDVKSFMNEQ